MDAGSFRVFSFPPMACYQPNPLIEQAPHPGDGERGRKFLTDVCVHASRLPPECQA